MYPSLPLLAAWYGPVLLVLAALALTKRFRVRWAWAGAAFLAYAVYVGVGHATLPADIVTPEARVWSRLAGLAVAAAMTALALVASRRVTRKTLGLSLRQRRGSMPWIALGLGILVLIGALPGGIATGAPVEAGPLLYHLTLPGVEEELIYRGLIAGLFAATLDGEHAIGWGVGLASLLFALAHAFAAGPDGATTFNLAMLLLTGAAGAVLAFLRLKTGSLLAPAIGHNLLGAALRYL